jgi:hypothetical protein
MGRWNMGEWVLGYWCMGKRDVEIRRNTSKRTGIVKINKNLFCYVPK